MDREMKSPPSTCPYTVTARRNPHRKARTTPATNDPSPPAVSTSNIAQTISSFPLDDILSIQVAQDVQSVPTTSSLLTDNLNVFLRIRPLKPLQTLRKMGESKLLPRPKNCWPQNPATKNAVKEKKGVKKSEVCIVVNDDLRSVTLSPPLVLQDTKKMKTEVYEGFSHVFSADSTQGEVYERMVNPLVEDFLRGKSRMLAALGPSGSGKTHTVFGCVREPGMVPLILHKIFKRTEGTSFEPPRTFYLSVFEICSERGKGERIIDLFPDGGDVFISHSGIKGLKELRICDVAEAEALISCALMKRATATTNTNSQSSRSQCIINIRYDLNGWDQEDSTRADNAVLTIVDLAGAEREKRTGNQGARLLESNFINNTSMVFGLCLRSLLEHQKNPKKKFQKHFQNSLLTRYLRDYLEGKKRMTLILTVKPGGEDYLDTSHLLRQASPYMKIKFDLVENLSTFPSNKRQFQPFLKSEQHKRVKVNCLDDYEIEEQKFEDPHSIEEMLPEMLKSTEPLIASSKENSQSTGRNNKIMQSFAKAIWNVLKEYRDKLRVAESELCRLRKENARLLKLQTAADSNALKVCGGEDGISIVEETGVIGYSLAEFVGSSPLPLVEVHNVCPSAAEVEQQNTEFKLSTNKRHTETMKETELSYALNTSTREDGFSNVDKTVDCFTALPAEQVIGTGLAEVAEISSELLADVAESSSQSPVEVSSDNPSKVKVEQQKTKLSEKLLDLPLPSLEDQAITEESKDVYVQESDQNLKTLRKPSVVEKPKRKLLPASSTLLRDITCLDFNDENARPKGNRGEKKLGGDERYRTQGSASLLRLLQSNLHL